MEPQTKELKWVAIWMLVVSVLHCGVAVALYGGQYLSFAERGVLASVQDDGDRLALWFIASGFLMAVIGLCLHNMPVKPLSVGIGLTLTAIIGVVLLPASGFWVVLPPGIAIMFKRYIRSIEVAFSKRL